MAMSSRLRDLISTHNERRAPDTPSLTYRALAEELGTNAALISRHVNDQVRMTYESAQRYAAFFGVRVCAVDDRFSDAT
jgi:hypothetical protein